MARGKWWSIAGWAILVLAVYSFPPLAQDPYLVHVVNLAVIALIVTVGLNLLAGYAGQISIGHGAFYLVGAYAGALLVLNLHAPFLLTLPVAAAAAALLGWVVGRPTLRLKGAYLAMATLGIVEIVQVVALNWTGFTGGALGLSNIPPAQVFGITLNSETSYFYFVAIVAVIVYLGVNRLLDSELGRAWRAIRDNEVAAQVMGIDVARLKSLAFVISCAAAGLAGALYAPLVTFVSPSGFGFNESVALLTMALAGGLGWRFGPIFGVALLSFAQQYLQALNSLQLVVYGVLLTAVILFMPQGIAGGLTAAWQHLCWRRAHDA